MAKPLEGTSHFKSHEYMTRGGLIWWKLNVQGRPTVPNPSLSFNAPLPCHSLSLSSERKKEISGASSSPIAVASDPLLRHSIREAEAGMVILMLLQERIGAFGRRWDTLW
ncbi:hypothetical protein COCNU_07G000400 [Cocos nucifera]|uniref:Uncharacterized protein n=1 Tax=Cocos nucifera TaxID=13894 RepID=A0A8K0N432_COCNU|nr:hypothetical protein COCNU_07G000400 [Cocos nucifera]